MLRPRVIPCLLLDDGGLVKTVRFKGAKYVGDPINAIRIFNDKRVDELMVLDISASRQRREPNYALIEEIAGECFMPLAYGGGISSVDQAARIVGLGAEKIVVSHSALQRPELCRELAAQLGSQSVVGCVNVKRSWTGKLRLFDSTERKVTSIDPIDYASSLVASGVGEILVNDVDRDGTLEGYDLKMVQSFTDRLPTPVIACGGAWTLEHLRGVIRGAGASAAAAGSMFVFQGPHRAVLISYPPYEELSRLIQA